MLTQKQINEIKEHLEKAQNPVFFFDNDVDGLCSFLLLQRYIGRGKGVQIKSFPELTANYFRKVEELNADYVFILDKAEVSQEFFKEARQVNIPVVWIDHHEIPLKLPDFVNYYNPMMNKDKLNEAVTYLCYQVTKKNEDLWLAVAGCIADSLLPDFYPAFEKKYSDLVVKGSVWDIYYKSQIGKLAQILDAGLKDRITNVINMLKFLMKVKTPYEVLEENNKNRFIHERFRYIYDKQRKLINKAKKVAEKDSKILFFKYGGDLSISSALAGELKYLFPDKVVVVVYLIGIKTNISVRGKNIREKVLKAIKGFEDATGGGHANAVGAKLRVDDLEEFRKRFERLVEK